ncbi:neprilysin [Candidatus Mancarchaeum acidiphilum]|uniref:Neprilysin n=1 Tax=Candidatus Mancarchaeum acidiphilum TaxID=1920749 RepID=A0A218NMH4_9ARCH|nr:M13 family metallopeptidase [Candidatus Mancarchaeum acidiphilum]ASI13663.1 neprilysin [Candidatus Mancarchaeum acidiphilum]
MPKNIGFSIKDMDLSVDPFEDFYKYSAGSWIKSHPLPKDKIRIDSFYELHDRNQLILKEITESCAYGKARYKNAKIIRDFYLSYIDDKTVEGLKFKPISSIMDKIASMSSKSQLPEIVASIIPFGAMPFFDINSSPDDRNSSVYALYLWQGGITLPERDYYLSKNFSAILEKYKEHIEEMFRIYGKAYKSPELSAKAVLKLETSLAKASRSSADTRDAIKNYNKASVKEVSSKYANFNIIKMFKSLGVNKIPYFVLGQPEFFTAFDKMVKESSLDDIKAYLQWNVLHASAPLLHKKVKDESFRFFNKELLGQKKRSPKWKRALSLIESLIGEALGEVYVKDNFTDRSRKEAERLFKDIKQSFRARIQKVDWMSNQTKSKAIDKLDSINAKIGYPIKFRDYSKLKTSPKDLFGNKMNAYMLEFNRDMSRIGKEVDKNEWLMNAYEVNAYYDQSKNEIVLPAGIFQPPFFDYKKDFAINYGAIGGVIGHELTHGFDDQGSKYDKFGNINEWWTKADRKNFGERAGKIVELYDSLEIMPNVKLDGRLTLGENIADLGGISIAYDALKSRMKEAMPYKAGGFNREQLFFISWSQLWKGNTSEGALKMLSKVDPHSPDKFRGTVPPVTHPEFPGTFKQKSKLKKPKYKFKYVNLW